MPYVISPITGQQVQVGDNSPLLNTWQRVPDQSTQQSVPAGQTNIVKQDVGYGGQMSQSDMAAFLSKDSNAQQSYLSSNATTPTASQAPAPVSYGGYTYGTDPAKDKALNAGIQTWSTDPAERQKEIDRTLAVIMSRQAAGQDITAQNNHLYGTLKYDPSTSTATDSGTTGMIPLGTQQSITSPANSLSNAQSYIDQLEQARKSKAYADLGKARDNALSNLGQEKAAIQPKYYDARNQAAAGSQQQARNFAEFMAARGGTNSGANAQAELSNNMTLQGNLGSLGRQETQAYTDIARRETDVQNAFQSDVASANAGIDADKMNALLQDYYIAQQRGDTLAQRAIENEFAKAGLTGNYNGDRTIAGQQLDYNTSPNNPANVGQNLQNQLAQLQLADYPEQSKAQAKLIQQQLDTGQMNVEIAKINLKELQDPNSATNQAAKLDLQIKQLEAKNLPEQQKLQLQQLRKQIAQIGAAPYQSQSDIEMDKVKLATAQEQLKQLQNPQPNPTTQKTADDYIKQLDSSSYITTRTDLLGNKTQVVTNEKGLEDYIFLLDLSEAETKKLYARYGLKWGG